MMSARYDYMEIFKEVERKLKRKNINCTIVKEEEYPYLDFEVDGEKYHLQADLSYKIIRIYRYTKSGSPKFEYDSTHKTISGVCYALGI